jgi:methyltransferase family protein
VKELVWYPERGLGWYPVEPSTAPYDEAYFAKYAAYAATPLGQALTAARLELVQRFLPDGLVVDIGIGCGAFVEARQVCAPTMGWDRNPAGLAWLVERNLLCDPWNTNLGISGLTFWDALEHIPDPEALLAMAEWHFVALPLFTGPEHVLRSKHFRRDEHCWYFTRDGLLGWFAAQGFRCLEHSTRESLLGREDIHSFVFTRT